MRSLFYRIGLLTLFVPLIFLAGCKAGKKITDTTTTMQADNETIRKVLERQMTDRFIEIRCAGKARTGEESVNFQGTVRILRDEAVWVSLRSKLGIEIARVLTEPDSVWINSRLLRIKEKGNWKLLEQYSGYPVNFIAFQGILLQTLFSWDTDEPSRLLRELRYRPGSEGNWIYALPTASAPDGAKKAGFRFLADGPDYLVKSVDMIDQQGGIVGSVQYQYHENQVIKNITVRGAEKRSDFGLDLEIISLEVVPGLEISFDKW